MTILLKFHLWIFVCASAVVSHLALAACPADWLYITTQDSTFEGCFKIFSAQSRSFDSAALFCQGQGGYLARDTSQSIHQTLQAYVRNEAKSATRFVTFWIGLTDNNVNNGPWVWIGGPELGTFRSFGNLNATNTPNVKDCTYVSAIDANMNWIVNTKCNTLLPFICERDINGPPIPVTTSAPVNCPPGWIGYPPQQTCIILKVDSKKSWTDARSVCKQSSGDLVKIGDANFKNFIISQTIKQRGVYWIGLNDRANPGMFVWLDETTKANFSNEDRSSTNFIDTTANCVAVDSTNNFMWYNDHCEVTNRFICQRSPFSGTPAPNTASTLSNANCGPGWVAVPDSDSCFKINTNLLPWLWAQADCQNNGGSLASIANVQEQSFLLGLTVTMSGDFLWIGANDKDYESGWVWSDGAPFAFLNWDARQPDNSHDSDCAAFVLQTGRWDDLPCQSQYGYICKKKGSVTLPPPTFPVTTTPAYFPGDVVFGCPAGWSTYRGSCYKVAVSSTGIDWTTASSSCSDATMQGALASIADESENMFIWSMLPANDSEWVWIGLQDPQENSFTWVDGSPVTYTNWNPGEPNNVRNEDCVVMSAKNGKWIDAQCSITNFRYVCKKSKSLVPNIDSNQNQGCPTNSIAYRAQCYSFITAAKNFSDAQKDCQSKSGNLATIDSAYLQAFFSSQLSTMTGPSYWIGLSQSGSYYSWQSKWPVVFTYWGQNHTGNERFTCVAMQQTKPEGLWVNYPCSTLMPYVCESPRAGFTTPLYKTMVTVPLPCPVGWSGFREFCYRKFPDAQQAQLSWGDARDFCKSLAPGGSLATILVNATSYFIYNNVIKPGATSTDHFWIGLNDRDSENGYHWVEGYPLLYTNWALNQPDDSLNREDCVEWLYLQNGWNDQYCYVANKWICQVPRGSVITTAKPPVTGAVSPQCGNTTWILYNNFCYLVSQPGGDTALATWFDARQRCLDVGADLASIHGDDENGFITTLVSKNPINTFWIGLNDLDMNTYGWTDKRPVNYVAWALNEPNDSMGEERCVEMTSVGSWNDVQCQSKLGYVCKKRPGNFTPAPQTTTAPTGGCPDNFVSLPSLSYCYWVGGTTSDTQMNYDDAMSVCDLAVSKATLASIHSPLEEKLILILMSDVMSPAWIGLNDRLSRNKFVWVDNLEVTYTNWGPGQPDENLNDNNPNARRDCVDIEIRLNQGNWHDRRCDSRLAYVCEAKKVATLPTSAPNTTGCSAGYQRFRSSCYRYYPDALNWTAAQSICQADHGNLVTFSSGIEQAYAEILTPATDSTQFWIGLKYSNTTFTWADGWPVRFTNWGKDEPNMKEVDKCVSHTVDGQWQVVPCALQLSFVCEVNFASPPPPRVFNNTGRCPDRTWISYAGNCYHIETSTPVTWAEANLACKNLGANLTSIHSQSESVFLTNATAAVGKDTWIGLFKGQGSGYSWYDGTELQYMNWESGEPDDKDGFLHQDCVKIVGQDGTWDDTDCGDKNAYICKTSMRWRPGFNSNGTYPTRGPGRRTNQGSSNSPFRRSSRFPNQGNSSRPTGRNSRPPNDRSSTVTPQPAQTQPNAGAFGYSKTSYSSVSELSGGAVAGVVIGTLILIAAVAVVGFVVYRRSHGQPILWFRIPAQRLTTSDSGFGNVTYSASNEDKVNLAKET